jgi:hypothetical protein
VHRASAGLVLAALSSACEPELVVGSWMCPPPDADLAPANPGKRIEASWTTGFETGFCDYMRAGGICYASPDASYSIVNEPVHSGSHAAAYFVTSDPSGRALQARCFREGALPLEAVYGVWFYLPSSATNTGNWNLVHFQGGKPGGPLHNLWDVSLRSADDGALSAYLFDFLNAGIRVPKAAPAVPIGSWFHLEFRLRRASDATGEVALYQDGTLLIEVKDLPTDDTDYGQWYVGNFADALTPPASTIYVDDVTIRAVP